MLFRSSLTILGLAIVGLIGGCCSCGTCDTSATSSETVYSGPTYAEAAPADCGCGCSAAAPTSYDSYPQSAQAGSDSSNVISESNSANANPYYVGDAVETSTSASPAVVEPPSDNTTSGFTAGSSTRSNDNTLPGNFLPNN